MAQASPIFTPDSEFADLETSRDPTNGSLSITALARFEFEAGRGNDGTKILMVEWEDDDHTRSAAEGSWHVSWAGKTAVMPADDRPSDSLRRCYFLLPPNSTIPPVVTLSYEPLSAGPKSSDVTAIPSNKTAKSKDTFQLNPLPAIFPPGLGATGRAAGKKGVLHSIWAKKRLRILEKEIAEESRNNVEGIALSMAIDEKDWIELNFGVTLRSADASNSYAPTSSSIDPVGLATPVSPVSGRKLSDKLKGLKLQTSEKDLATNNDGGSGPNIDDLLSPQSPDVAVSSFSSFHNVAHKHIHSMPTPDSYTKPPGPESLRPVALFPPSSLQEAQQGNEHEPTGFAAMGSFSRIPSNDSGDDLFAKALSPRSPDLPRSPFSFA